MRVQKGIIFSPHAVEPNPAHPHLLKQACIEEERVLAQTESTTNSDNKTTYTRPYQRRQKYTHKGRPDKQVPSIWKEE